MSKRFLTRQNIFIPTLGMLMLCIVLLGACTEDTKVNTQTTLTVVKMDASWHMHYANVKSAKQDPDLNLIIAGTAVNLKPSQTINGLVSTDVVFNITRTAWNPQNLPIGSTIIVRTIGGTIGNRRYEVDDFPMHQIGQHEILFLHFDRGTGIAGTLGGPSGRLIVQNGQVKPLNNEGMNIPSNTLESSFLAKIPSA